MINRSATGPCFGVGRVGRCANRVDHSLPIAQKGREQAHNRADRSPQHRRVARARSTGRKRSTIKVSRLVASVAGGGFRDRRFHSPSKRLLDPKAKGREVGAFGSVIILCGGGRP